MDFFFVQQVAEAPSAHRDANLWISKIWRSGVELPPQRKADETYSPSNRLTCPQIDLELPMFILTLQREKKEEDFKVIRGLPKVNQS